MNSKFPPLSELDSRLLFNALERSNRDLLPGIWHRYTAGLYRMLELLMAARLRNLKPAVCPKHFDNLTAVHFVHSSTTRIHTSYTLINSRQTNSRRHTYEQPVHQKLLSGCLASVVAGSRGADGRHRHHAP